MQSGGTEAAGRLCPGPREPVPSTLAEPRRGRHECLSTGLRGSGLHHLGNAGLYSIPRSQATPPAHWRSTRTRCHEGTLRSPRPPHRRSLPTPSVCCPGRVAFLLRVQMCCRQTATVREQEGRRVQRGWKTGRDHSGSVVRHRGCGREPEASGPGLRVRNPRPGTALSPGSQGPWCSGRGRLPSG